MCPATQLFQKLPLLVLRYLTHEAAYYTPRDGTLSFPLQSFGAKIYSILCISQVWEYRGLQGMKMYCPSGALCLAPIGPHIV